MNRTFRFPNLIACACLLGILSVAPSLSMAQSVSHRPAPPPAVTATPFFGKHIPLPQSVQDVYDHGDPTAEEQYELELINRARANPTAEGVRLATTQDPDVSSAYDYWKTPTRSQVQSDFSKYSPKPPLAFNKDLIKAARRHSQDMLDHNYQDHNSPTDGSTPFTRMQEAGYTGYQFAGENIFAYGVSMWDIQASFEIDFGNPGLGHRENLINFGAYVYSEIGIGILHGGTGAPNVGPLVTTEDFGTINGNIFITGVVYGDDNHNNFYDIGEGLSGVTIMVSDGSGSAVSSTSGGYAIPFTTGAGTVTVTASGGLLTTPISHQVNLNDVNVKVDFIQGATGLPEQAQAVFPISDTVVHSDTVQFKWNAVTGATKYRFQLATDPQMKKLISNDSLLTTAGKKFGALKDATPYYWRVQARNINGWGQYSPIVSFNVALPLKAVTLMGPADGTNIGKGDITLFWHNTTPEANDYLLEVSDSKNMANPIHRDTLYPSPDTTITYSSADFQPGTTYYWRVRAENDNGIGAPSSVWSFITGGVSSVNYSAAGSLHTFISPNPTSGQTHIRFSLDRSSDVALKIFGVTGIEESYSNLGKLQPQSYDILWNASGKAEGVYIYDLSIGNAHETGRIVVIK